MSKPIRILTTTLLTIIPSLFSGCSMAAENLQTEALTTFCPKKDYSCLARFEKVYRETGREPATDGELAYVYQCEPLTEDPPGPARIIHLLKYRLPTATETAK